jgi:hypothetical protein
VVHESISTTHERVVEPTVTAIDLQAERLDHVEGLYFFDIENGEYCGRTIRFRTIPGFFCLC